MHIVIVTGVQSFSAGTIYSRLYLHYSNQTLYPAVAIPGCPQPVATITGSFGPIAIKLK